MTWQDGEPRSREQLKDTLVTRRLILALAILMGLTVLALLVF